MAKRYGEYPTTLRKPEQTHLYMSTVRAPTFIHKHVHVYMHTYTCAKVNPLTPCAEGLLVKPAAGVRRRGRSSWKTDGPSRKTKPAGCKVHHMRLIQLAPHVVRVQDDIVGLNFPTSVHLDLLVEATEGYVLCEVGQVRAWQPHSSFPGVVDGLGQQVDAVIDGPK